MSIQKRLIARKNMPWKLLDDSEAHPKRRESLNTFSASLQDLSILLTTLYTITNLPPQIHNEEIQI